MLSAKKEIQLLQAELAEMRKDKMQVEEQLKEALEEPIATPTITESNEGKVLILDFWKYNIFQKRFSR